MILPEGPLYRAEGRHVTIECEVQGTQPSQEQSFEWSVTLQEKPSWAVQIISTHDPDYTYAMYGQRVESGEIYVERITSKSVRLHITNLRKSDEGEYKCQTPNMEEIYWGSYNAITKLTGRLPLLSVQLSGHTAQDGITVRPHWEYYSTGQAVPVERKTDSILQYFPQSECYLQVSSMKQSVTFYYKTYQYVE